LIKTGNTDWAQGVYIKDLKNKKAKWQIISWDFDRVARPVKGESMRTGMSDASEMLGLSLGMDSKVGTIRWSIFNRLIKDDKKFREYFSKLYDKLINILKSSEFAKEMAFYEKLALDSKDNKTIASIKHLKLFFSKRNTVFCNDLKERLDLVPESCDH